MYGAILLPPYSDYADMTVLFMHNEGYSTMCGHGIIAITTGLIEEGLYPATEPVTTIRYEVPAGIVAANAATVQLDDGDVGRPRRALHQRARRTCAAQSLSVRPDGVALFGTAAQYGALSVDLAFGGAYYGIVNAAELGLRVVPEQADELRRVGAAITEVLRRDHTPAHPIDPDPRFVYGTIIVDLDPRTSPDGQARRRHMRNATIFADAELDRSPCGSGTSAILAQLHARGRIKVGQEIVNAGITGEHFLGRVEAETALGPYPAVSTSIAGTAYRDRLLDVHRRHARPARRRLPPQLISGGPPRVGYPRGSHLNVRSATTSPITAQAATHTRSIGSSGPIMPGVQMLCSATAKWRTGKMLAILANRLSDGMCRKMSEMNNRGRMIALTTAGAARSLGTIPVMARPRPQKHADPSNRVTTRSGSSVHGNATL